ncbi:hypothetical protein [Actinomadura rupiterrae]|uniref:hypothetical protein n=1 Tax=Actinomadura rupiterrae TaxID=559627 RepID=UPI0020A325AE|nr:hypothetical protein [Actinomadura rupiterrae]MCP2342979.1 D-serine deaminase-like pyridoxal phosphate-dependent protein [Actinomadura rupiterrae]
MDVLRDGRWWTYVAELSEAFQVERITGDGERRVCWGNQVVGRTAQAAGRWRCCGRDDVELSNGTDDEPFPSAAAALVRARDAW